MEGPVCFEVAMSLDRKPLTRFIQLQQQRTECTKTRKVAIVKPMLATCRNTDDNRGTANLEQPVTTGNSTASTPLRESPYPVSIVVDSSSSSNSGMRGRPIGPPSSESTTVILGPDGETSPATRTFCNVETMGISSFYYPDLTMREAKRLLKAHPDGTFLLRKSSETLYPYCLSVKTKRGTTSVRIVQTASGSFRLDCDPAQEELMPHFQSVHGLIVYYLEQSRMETGRYVFMESTGRMDVPVYIRQPLLADNDCAVRNASPAAAQSSS